MKNEFGKTSQQDFVTAVNGAMHAAPRAIRAAGSATDAVIKGDRVPAMKAMLETHDAVVKAGSPVTEGFMTTAIRLVEHVRGKTEAQKSIQKLGASNAPLERAYAEYRRVDRESIKVVPAEHAELLMGALAKVSGHAPMKVAPAVDQSAMLDRFAKLRIKDNGAQSTPAGV